MSAAVPAKASAVAWRLSFLILKKKYKPSPSIVPFYPAAFICI